MPTRTRAARPSPPTRAIFFAAALAAAVLSPTLVPLRAAPAAGSPGAAAAPLTPQQRSEALKLAYEYRRAHTDDQREKIVEQAAASNDLAKSKVLEQVHHLLTRDSGRYQTMYLRAAEQIVAAMRSKADATVVQQQRDIVEKVLQKPTKDAVHETADPALAKLREMLVPDSAAVMSADARLTDLRKSLQVCAEQAARLGDAPADRTLGNFDKATIVAALGTPVDRSTVAANTRVYPQLDAEEVAGFLELDLIRVLLNRPVQLIDLKLVAAARGHSQEMVDKHYFSHESPTPAVKTPWDRARLAGTSANAENIAAGTNSGVSVIGMWWHSPGHLTNMMAPHRRVGLGRYNADWTQMFGS